MEKRFDCKKNRISTSRKTGIGVDKRTDPVVEAQNVGGVRDTDFTDTVTLSETGASSSTFANHSVAALTTLPASNAVSVQAGLNMLTSNGLRLDECSSAPLSNRALKAGHVTQSDPTKLTFTLTSLPVYGQLSKSGQSLAPNDQVEVTVCYKPEPGLLDPLQATPDHHLFHRSAGHASLGPKPMERLSARRAESHLQRGPHRRHRRAQLRTPQPRQSAAGGRDANPERPPLPEPHAYTLHPSSGCTATRNHRLHP